VPALPAELPARGQSLRCAQGRGERRLGGGRDCGPVGLRRYLDDRPSAERRERETVLRRLSKRGFGFGLKRERWAVDRLDDCLARLREPEFAAHIHTDQRTVPQVADKIARMADLPIRPDTDGPLCGSLRRYATTLRHVRLD
jgi:hypothetical protein